MYYFALVLRTMHVRHFENAMHGSVAHNEHTDKQISVMCT